MFSLVKNIFKIYSIIAKYYFGWNNWGSFSRAGTGLNRCDLCGFNHFELRAHSVSGLGQA